MGSEAAPASFIEFHITGFKKFHGVAENPTEVLVGTIEEYVRKHDGMPTGTLLGSCTVLETAGEGALGPLMELLDSSLVGIEHPSIERSGNSQELKLDVNSLATIQKKIVWVHFGVNSGATNFAVEWRAVNEATFRCADELGWQPQHAPITTEDGPISHIRETTLPVKEIVTALQKEDFNVTESYDAGRFVCNYVYYHSLCHAAAHGTRSLFVHVPLFKMIDKEQQMKFAEALLHVLAEFC
jgi:pyroglutamyl-peptidase